MEALKALLESDAISEAMKSEIQEAWETKVQENKLAVTAELREDRKQLAEQKAKYAMKMREDADLMASFVKKTLVKEVSELHEDQKAMASKFAMLEEFVVEQLTSELAEFQED